MRGILIPRGAECAEPQFRAFSARFCRGISRNNADFAADSTRVQTIFEARPNYLVTARRAAGTTTGVFFAQQRAFPSAFTRYIYIKLTTMVGIWILCLQTQTILNSRDTIQISVAFAQKIGSSWSIEEARWNQCLYRQVSFPK